MAAIKAPWTEGQVESLRGYQDCPYVHPYTNNKTILIPTQDGWIEAEDGPVIQDWAHDFSLDWKWRAWQFPK